MAIRRRRRTSGTWPLGVSRRRRTSSTSRRRRSRRPAKRSGAKYKMVRTGGDSTGKDEREVPCVYGWRTYQGMLQKAVCVPARSGRTVDPMNVRTKDGSHRIRMVCRIETPGLGLSGLHSGFFDPVSRKVRIPKLNLVLSPGAPNGGYFGAWLRREIR